MTLEKDAVSNDSGNQILLYQIIGLILYAATASLVYPTRILGVMDKFDPFQIAIVAIIFLSLLLQLHGDGTPIVSGIVYTIMLLVAMLLLSVIWTLPIDALLICLGGAAAILVAFGLSAIAILGLPENRLVGGIHPNFFGTIVLSAFIFSQFCKGASMLALRIACVILAASVSSRFAITGCLIAFVMFEFTFNPFNPKIVVLVVLAGAGVLLFSQHLTDVFALNDPARNLDSGFTGREDAWEGAFDAIANNPLGVGFKRALIEEAGHNGYLKALVEFGIIGGGLMIAALLCILVAALLTAAMHLDQDERIRRLSSARAAGLFALAFATFFQPQMLNLGDVHGISFILLMFSPMAFSGRRIRLTSHMLIHSGHRSIVRYLRDLK